MNKVFYSTSYFYNRIKRTTPLKILETTFTPRNNEIRQKLNIRRNLLKNTIDKPDFIELESGKQIIMVE